MANLSNKFAAADTSTAIKTNVAGQIAAITEKALPSRDDLMLIEDAGDSNSKKFAKLFDMIRQVSGVYGVYAQNVPDDQVWKYDFGKHVQGLVFIGTNNSAWHFQGIMRTDGGSFLTEVDAHTIFETTTGALSNGDGTDGVRS